MAFPGVPTVLVGAGLASGLFLAALGVLAATGPTRVVPAAGQGFALGVVLLAFTPASWTFHTSHTESLFLLLSLLALLAAGEGRWLAAGLVAGLACLTRRPRACWWRSQRWRWWPSGPGARDARRSPLCSRESPSPDSSPSSGSGRAIPWPSSTRRRTGLTPTRRWRCSGPSRSGIPGRTPTPAHSPGTSSSSGRWPPRSPCSGGTRILGLYCLASLALLPLQGELVNAFRFTAVLFPLHLWAGERLAAAPVPLRALGVATWLATNVWVTRELAYGKWAY